MLKGVENRSLTGVACTFVLSLVVAIAQANQEKPDRRLYGIDSDHTQATFEFRRFGISTVTARFAKTGGVIAISREPHALNATLSIDVDSVSTGSAWLDRRLKSDSFLDAQRYPTITFKSTDSRYSGDRLNSVSGELTIHGVTRPASFDIGEYSCAEQSAGSPPQPCEARAELVIKRSDYGINGLMAIVSDRVVIRIKVSAQPMNESEAQGLS